MAILTFTGKELSAEASAIARRRMEAAIVGVQVAITVKAAEIAGSLKHTWSKYQPDYNWSGSFQASIRAAAGSPDTGYIQGQDGSWPSHPNQLPAASGAEIASEIFGMAPYQMVYLTDNAPHAAKVEQKTGTFAKAYAQISSAAAEFTRSYFQSGAWTHMINVV